MRELRGFYTEATVARLENRDWPHKEQLLDRAPSLSLVNRPAQGRAAAVVATIAGIMGPAPTCALWGSMLGPPGPKNTVSSLASGLGFVFRFKGTAHYE